jgi:hypothetical protein
VMELLFEATRVTRTGTPDQSLNQLRRSRQEMSKVRCRKTSQSEVGTLTSPSGRKRCKQEVEMSIGG